MSASDPNEAAPVRPERHRIRRLVGGAVVLLVAYIAVTAVQVFGADDWDHTRRSDAAVVLGAAQYNGRPSAAFRGRLDKAFDLHERGIVSVVVVTGGAAEGDRFTEAYSGLRYLRRLGVPEGDVIVVDDGSSTWESLAASTRVLRKRGIRDVLLVSDPFHSFRLEGIAQEVGLAGHVSPTSARSSKRELVRETMLVAVGRIIGYRRLVNLVE